MSAAQYYKVTTRVGVPHRNAVEVTIPLVGPVGPAGATGATGAVGPQGPQGIAGTGIETLTTKGDLLSRNDSAAIRVGIGSTGQILKVSAQGLPHWANESGAVSSVAGRTGAVTLVSVDVSSEQVLEISEAGDANCNGVFVYGGDFNGRPTFYKDKDTFLYWDNVWNISHNSYDKYVGTNTSRPWQSVWSLGTATGNLPVVEQLNGQEYEKAVGQRTNPTLRGDAAGKNVGTGANDVSAGNHTHSAASQSVAGFLSASDKSKLDGVAAGAEVNVNADWNASSGDAQILNKPSSFTPSAHASSHASAGSDPVFDQNLNTTDVVTFNEVNLTNLIFTGAGSISNSDQDASVTLNAGSVRLGGSIIETYGNLAVLDVSNGNSVKSATFDAQSNLTANRTYDLPDASGTLALTSDIPAAGIGGSTGATNQAVLRASGTGGSTAQSSDLIVDDPVVAFACTGDASTDIITAVGHNFTENQRIRFQSLTGGSGLFFGGPASSTNYFVRNISGNTFQVSTTSGGAAVNFTTNITAGAVLAVQRNLTLRTRKQAFAMTADAASDVITATGHTFVNGDAVSFYNLTGGNNLDEVSRWYVVEAATNTFKVSNSLNGTARDITASYTGGTVELEIPLVLGLPRSSALILGEKPDGTIIGGNVRGYGAVDLQTNRNGQNAIASGTFSFIGNGQNNTASALRAIVVGGTGNTASATDAVIGGGQDNQATAQWACVAGGNQNIASGSVSFAAGASNNTSGATSAVVGGRNAAADRESLLAHASGRFGAQGDAQTVRTSLRNKTSTATAVELQMGFSLGSRYTIPSGKTVSALINIIAATSGGEFANRYVRAVTIANRGGTTALRGAIKDIDTDEQIGGADISITADDANDALRIEFSGVAPVTGCTGTASTDRINKVAHGYSNNDDIVFTSLTGGAGLTANTVTYWVINANADDFQVSATRGGAAVNITTDYTDMTAARLFRVVAGIDAVELGHGT